MSFAQNIGAQIQDDFKSYLPFYQQSKSIEEHLRFFKKNHAMRNYYLHDKRYDRYAPKIKQLKNIHEGERCFIIGCGPSLNKTNLDYIKNEIVFGVNGLFKAMEKYGFSCTYYAISDHIVWHQLYQHILSLDTQLFIGGYAGKEYLSHIQRYNHIEKHPPILLKNIWLLRYSGWKDKSLINGTYAAHQIIADIPLQLAYYMGFKEVYLLGCDCDYSGKHHFDGEKRKSDPQSKYSEGYWNEVFEEYRIIKKAFDKDGRTVYNSTVGGQLEVFERKSLEDIFDN